MESGAEIAVKEITKRISNIEFDVITMRFSRAHPRKEKIGNCTIYRINGGFGYFSKIIFVPHAALLALKLDCRRKYDALWAIMTYMLFPIVLMRLLGHHTFYILTLQDGDPFTQVFNRLRILIFRPLLSYGFRHAGKVQAISNFLAEWAREMGYKGRIEVIPNGVNTEKFQNVQSRALDKNEIVLITTSRLVEKNAVGDIIDALEFLPESVSLKIIGTGPLESELKLKTKKLKSYEARVKFLGHIPYSDISKYLHDADIFVRPSLSEGFGSSFIEAMAAGLPVIATPVGGIVDFLKNGETGLFCEVNNPESIARQVRRLMENEDLKKVIVENAKKMVKEKYDWSLIAREMKTQVFDKV